MGVHGGVCTCRKPTQLIPELLQLQRQLLLLLQGLVTLQRQEEKHESAEELQVRDSPSEGRPALDQLWTSSRPALDQLWTSSGPALDPSRPALDQL